RIVHDPPRATLFPYTTLFRSVVLAVVGAAPDALAADQDEVVVPGIHHQRRAPVEAIARVDPAGFGEMDAGIGRAIRAAAVGAVRSEEHTSELQSRFDLVCRPL